MRKLHQGYGPNVRDTGFPWSNERRKLRTLSEHLDTPLRLPLSLIDASSTLMAPKSNPTWSPVVHIKMMHAFTEPESLAPLTRAYRLPKLPADVTGSPRRATTSTVKSLRTEVTRHLQVDPAKLRLIPEVVDHDLFKPGDPDAARAHVKSYGVTKPFVLFGAVVVAV